ncbi:uncharacterized protein LOC5513401 [Nematostella vectensis]|uniref:uncharacterized protein LOC5513401 n=1 Tax=Nematostella vectensis TaxID=45351 RepID=UPI0020776E97|nr:uncharacterized protein LOC5513401 [Nematostella vectensis]
MAKMKLSPFDLKELDEEMAARSVIVKDFPVQVTDKDLCIHFQKSSNGGDDVDEVRLVPEHNPTTAIVTFDDPNTVESVLAKEQIFKGVLMTVQRCSVAHQTTEVFSSIKATLNIEYFDVSTQDLHELLACLRSDAPGVRWTIDSDNRVVLKGVFADIVQAQTFLSDYVNCKGLAPVPHSRGSLTNGTAPQNEAAVEQQTGSSGRNTRGKSADTSQPSPTSLHHVKDKDEDQRRLLSHEGRGRGRAKSPKGSQAGKTQRQDSVGVIGRGRSKSQDSRLQASAGGHPESHREGIGSGGGQNACVLHRQNSNGTDSRDDHFEDCRDDSPPETSTSTTRYHNAQDERREGNEDATKPFQRAKLQPEKYSGSAIAFEFITRVQQYKDTLDGLKRQYSVNITSIPVAGGVEMAVVPGVSCTEDRFSQACEEFIRLFQRAANFTRHELDAGDQGLVQYCCQEVMMKFPVLSMPGSRPEKIVLYGEDGAVADAKAMIEKMAQINTSSSTVVSLSSSSGASSASFGQYQAPQSFSDVVRSGDHNKQARKGSSFTGRHTDEKDSFQIPENVRTKTGKADIGSQNAEFDQTTLPSQKLGSEDKTTFKTKKGFTISVYKGDITEETVDAIVSPIGEALVCTSKGLSGVVATKGGRQVEDQLFQYSRKKWFKPSGGEVVPTDSGNMKCKKIFHAIVTSETSNEKKKKLLSKIASRCLHEAQKASCNSLAFPAIGTVIHNIPLDLCACGMISGLEEYMKRGKLQDVRFVDLNPDAVDAFKEELKKRYASSMVVSPAQPSLSGVDPAPLGPHPDYAPPDESAAGRLSEGYSGRPRDLGPNGGSAAPLTSSLGDSTLDVDMTEDGAGDSAECPICLETITYPETLQGCGHTFCRPCITEASKSSKLCPTCRDPFGVQQGNMPWGTMNWKIDHYKHLPGYERWGTIVIFYYFPGGTQDQGHPHPGRFYTGTSRTAYLPDNAEGREVLGLLEKAFAARLTFTIGTSVTTGLTDTVTWNDIHHKTNVHGGPTAFGYPDPGYLNRVKQELAARGIR